MGSIKNQVTENKGFVFCNIGYIKTGIYDGKMKGCPQKFMETKEIQN
jgi:hypothetical protein